MKNKTLAEEVVRVCESLATYGKTYHRPDCGKGRIDKGFCIFSSKWSKDFAVLAKDVAVYKMLDNSLLEVSSNGCRAITTQEFEELYQSTTDFNLTYQLYKS